MEKPSQAHDEKIAALQQRYQRLFDRFNRRYFGARLPAYQIVLHARYEEQGIPLAGHCWKRARRIDLTAVPLPAGEGLLLHEMMHAAVTSPWHGQIFCAEVRRLAHLGAPLDRVDRDLAEAW
jgi:hypothetical protein